MLPYCTSTSYHMPHILLTPAQDADEVEDSVRFGEEALERFMFAMGGARMVPATLPVAGHKLASPQWQSRYAALRAIAILASSAGGGGGTFAGQTELCECTLWNQVYCWAESTVVQGIMWGALFAGQSVL